MPAQGLTQLVKVDAASAVGVHRRKEQAECFLIEGYRKHAERLAQLVLTDGPIAVDIPFLEGVDDPRQTERQPMLEERKRL